MNQKMKIVLALVLVCAIVSPTLLYVAYAAPTVDPWHVKIYQLLQKVYDFLTVDIENKLDDIEGKLWSMEDSVKNETERIENKTERLLAETPQGENFYYSKVIFVDSGYAGTETGSYTQPYDTIHEAINAVEDYTGNDYSVYTAIIVAAGDYWEDIYIEDKCHVHIFGAGPGKTWLWEEEVDSVIEIYDSWGIVISGFAISGLAYEDIYIEDAEYITIKNCLFYNGNDGWDDSLGWLESACNIYAEDTSYLFIENNVFSAKNYANKEEGSGNIWLDVYDDETCEIHIKHNQFLGTNGTAVVVDWHVRGVVIDDNVFVGDDGYSSHEPDTPWIWVGDDASVYITNNAFPDTTAGNAVTGDGSEYSDYFRAGNKYMEIYG